MEHRVNRRGRWELELVCHVASLGQDLERAEILEAELVVRAWRQRGLNVWLEAKVDVFPHLEGALGPVLVGLELHTLLCLQQMLADRSEHG